VIYVDNRDYDEDRRYEDRRYEDRRYRKKHHGEWHDNKNIKEENRKNVTMMIGMMTSSCFR
jgi:hypothetical protein